MFETAVFLVQAMSNRNKLSLMRGVDAPPTMNDKSKSCCPLSGWRLCFPLSKVGVVKGGSGV